MTKTITFMDRLDNFRKIGSIMAQANHHLTKKNIYSILNSHDIPTSTSETFFHEFCHFFDGMTGNNESQHRKASAGAKVAKMDLSNISTPRLAQHIKDADSSIGLRSACFLSAFSEGYYLALKQSA